VRRGSASHGKSFDLEIFMTPEAFRALIVPIVARVASKPLDQNLEADLNAAFPADGPIFGALRDACNEAIAAGWMCNREAGGIKFGRVIKPTDDTHGFSVDVVEMDDIKGPHHRHPGGEIDMIMPRTTEAKFDGRGAGWLVYGPDTAHAPTVRGGKALILYLLPQGAIEFSK
jgi:hypothetical protein